MFLAWNHGKLCQGSSRVLREKQEKEDKLFCPQIPFTPRSDPGADITHTVSLILTEARCKPTISFLWSLVGPEPPLISKRLEVSEPYSSLSNTSTL